VHLVGLLLDLIYIYIYNIYIGHLVGLLLDLDLLELDELAASSLQVQPPRSSAAPLRGATGEGGG